MARIIVMAGSSLGQQALDNECWSSSSALATALGEPVLLATIDEALLPVPEFVFPAGLVSHGENIWPVDGGKRKAPMRSAPFVYRPDGSPDWSAMWISFCDLALFGGPPHRGEASAIEASEVSARPPNVSLDAVAEIQRGIWETTGLESVPANPGWLALTCDSSRMAAWLAAAIILENVEARSDRNRLLVPADPAYELKDEVKSVITVAAKANHYWKTHVLGTQADDCSIVT
jgi:hypothetical protein